MDEVKKRGCIKETRGPWIVRRRGRGGAMTTSLRRPTDRERENNRERERKRRMLAARIFAGLRANGNYCLPKHADQNDVLKALCHEAGWHVDDDGNIYRRRFAEGPSSEDIIDSHSIYQNCNCSPSESIGKQTGDELSLELSLSFKYM